jgi:flavin reductase (DIM6/NTAB) family NADH-FMN oxidoreductase RutF
MCLAGAKVDGRPNFCAIAWFTMIDDEPPTIGMVMGKKRKTKDGILENRTFSINIPDSKLAVETDWCGLNTGYKVDKSGVFEVSYGALGSAPLIDSCPISLECKLSRVIELESVDLVIGEIEEVHMDESCMTGGKPDPSKMDPLLLLMPDGPYFSLGQKVADAYKVGKGFKPKKVVK